MKPLIPAWVTARRAAVYPVCFERARIALARFEKCRSSDALSRAFVVERAALRTMTTKSISSSSSRCPRKLSRTIRLSRLRSTARLACFLEIASPSLAWPVRPVTASTVKQRSADRWGPSNTRLKSAAESRRTARGNRLSGMRETQGAPAQGARRARPLARLAFRTLRPPRVAIRARKPWVRARLTRLG
jgi:hypothetical protein